jgi:hypothetical protein
LQGHQGVQGLQGIVGSSIKLVAADTNVVTNAGGLANVDSYLTTTYVNQAPFAQIGNGVVDSSTRHIWIYQGGGDWTDIGDLSVQGLQGSQGIQGLQGSQGVQGLQGNQGLAAAKQLGGDLIYAPGTSGTFPSANGEFKFTRVASVAADPSAPENISAYDRWLVYTTDALGQSLAGIFSVIDAVDNPQRAVVTISEKGNTAVFTSFLVTAPDSVLTGSYRTFTVSEIITQGTFVSGKQYTLTVSLVGAQGIQGVQGLQGVQGVQGLQANQGLQGGNSETSLIVALGDEFTNIGIGTSVVTFRAPFNFRLTEPPTISLSQPATVGITTVDMLYQARLFNTIGVGWTSLFSSATPWQKASIAVGGYDSYDSPAPGTTPTLNTTTGVVLSSGTPVINRNDKIRFDITGIGTNGKGLKATIYYSRIP